MADSLSANALAHAHNAAAAAAAADDRTPTTPKPHPRLLDRAASRDSRPPAGDDSTPSTPTMYSFAGIAGQRPLPNEPLTSSSPATAAILLPPRLSSRSPDSSSKEPTPVDRSQRSSVSAPPSADNQDVEMGDADDGIDVAAAAADGDGSDNDSVTSESQRPSKKKKGQRFFCTDFPPCQLSFTRSEHLARHIRKHTGERPFQCHCSRRFSRLDNLRQHAQTVHVNEEIPGDSLAATSTRFQRQIRTDRVRPPSGRSRGNTIAGQPTHTHSRGHSRNLSTSSIGSTTSSITEPDDTRRRPAPLAMAAASTNAAQQFGTPAGAPQYAYESSSGYSTPTSARYSTGTTSPQFSSGLASPISLSRSSYYNGARAPSRRLSVPSAQHSFGSNHAGGGNTYPPVYFSPPQSGSVTGYSRNSSVFASPTSSVFSHSRRESESELEYRRRTWHPSTYTSYASRPATSGLSYHQTPDDHRPAFSGLPAASQVTRLPGIESFDHAAMSSSSSSRQPPPPQQQQQSPTMMEATVHPQASAGRASDAGLHHNLTRLDIAAANAPQSNEMVWQSQPQAAAAAAQPQQGYFSHQPARYVGGHHHSQSMPDVPTTPVRGKRQAWYGGPATSTYQGAHGSNFVAHRTSPEDSGSSDGVPTPSTSQGGDYHPVIVNPNGTVEAAPPQQMMIDEQSKSYVYAQSQPPQTYALQAGHDPAVDSGFMGSSGAPNGNHDMGRLEALVAVATSENRAAADRA